MSGNVSGELILLKKSAELFHCKHTMLDGFAAASVHPTNVLNVFGWPASFSVEPLQTMFYLVTSTSEGLRFEGGEEPELM